ncbi:unnamed protein product [Spodoptera littoralis]|uniref:Uncharacterized protein n=1 Tax=Spodoptera littoralis TaxID=7109 RepID=A0A9P0II91_SPOLI|nr:unnamed protein product [Spodoptera littoralis]CAH1647345.1 unnamed protein product [Spodoptera littoralis]
MPSEYVHRQVFRVHIFQVRKRVMTDATTQAGSWNQIFNEIVSREDVRLRVMRELVNNPQSGVAPYLEDLRAENLSAEEFEQRALELLEGISLSYLTDLYVQTMPLQ